MASSTFIPAASALTLVFVEGESSQPQPFEIIGYAISEKSKPSPVTYPEVPHGAQAHVNRDGGWKLFDLANGRTIGATQTAPKWVKA